MYTVSLARFEGPLDLLLHLIEKAEVDIKDIFVSEITSQYLEYMKGLDELEPDAASEFVAMAATLLLIKSRTLLPKPEPVMQEEEDPETVLLRQIREYKLFKEASEELSALKADADRLFFRLPEEFPQQPPRVDLDGVSADALYEA
ncbi:MAG: segregation and condensation protein A, partial [Christensenellales bacterium]